MSDGDRLELLDYYTLLQIPDDAGPDVIRKSFHAFALKYHPDRHAGGGAERHEQAARIYRRGAEAYRVLGDPVTRRAYDAQLAGGALRFDPEKAEKESRTPSVAAAAVQSPQARPFVMKAEQALRAGDLKTARLNVQIALRHAPGSARLEAMLAEIEAKLKPAG
jgi:curved DNA-binding protein CbpA